jgi:hypothetical protein
MSMTIDQTALHHMIVSLGRHDADLRLSMETYPLMHSLLSADHAILEGGKQCWPCSFSAISGHQDGHFSTLAQRKALYQNTHDGA